MRSVLACALALLLCGSTGCGDEEDAPPQGTVTVSIPTNSTPEQGTARPPTASGEADGTGPAETATEDPRVTELEREAEQAVRSYFSALNDRNGEDVCALLAPGAIDEVELPIERGSCGASLTASIGYEDPRGLPVWAATEISALRVDVSGETAKAVVGVVTEFSDREPSFEDDIVYLVRADSRWLVAKPSATLYRAVGIADLPVEVLSPPD